MRETAKFLKKSPIVDLFYEYFTNNYFIITGACGQKSAIRLNKILGLPFIKK